MGGEGKAGGGDRMEPTGRGEIAAASLAQLKWNRFQKLVFPILNLFQLAKFFRSLIGLK